MIDDYEQAIALMEEMKASLPIPVTLIPSATKLLISQGESFSNHHVFSIVEVHYSGDEGGILCGLESEEGERKYYFSLTHLVIGIDHPLAEKIIGYQRKRRVQLALQDGKVGLAKRLAKQGKKKKGFGNF